MVEVNDPDDLDKILEDEQSDEPEDDTPEEEWIDDED